MGEQTRAFAIKRTPDQTGAGIDELSGITLWRVDDAQDVSPARIRDGLPPAAYPVRPPAWARARASPRDYCILHSTRPR